MIKNITIGSDPEFIIYNTETGKCYPSTEFTLGTKEEPENIGSGFFIQRDNALLEGNIPPSRSKHHFMFNMQYLIGYFENLIKEGNPNLRIMFADSGDYNPEDLAHPDMQVFGCDPYNNVWTGEEQRAPDLSEYDHRTCGFHIHVGYQLENGMPKEEFNKYIVKAFDRFVVLPSYLINLDPFRAKAYGGLGQYRDKEYGVECRSLGGYFCSPRHLEWVWDRTMEAVNFCKEESNLKVLDSMVVPSEITKAEVAKYLEKNKAEVKA